MVVPFGCDEACHQGAVAGLVSAGAFGADIGTFVHKVPAMQVVNVAVTVVVYAMFPVRFDFVRPELIAQVDVIDPSAVIEDRHGNGLGKLVFPPSQGTCDVINPPKIAGTVGAIVGARIGAGGGRQKSGADDRLARKSWSDLCEY